MANVNKQDRQAARTAADLERRKGFGRKFSEIITLLTRAEKNADDAVNAVDKFDKSLSQTEVLYRLTNGGDKQGMFMAPDGNIYVNASFIAAGTLGKGLLKIDLDTNVMEVFANREYSRRKFQIGRTNFGNGIVGIGELYDAMQGEMSESLLMQSVRVLDATKANRFQFTAFDTSLLIATETENFPENDPAVRIGEKSAAQVVINGKVAEWQWDNNKGEYWLIGRNE